MHDQALFYTCKITRADIRPQEKGAINLLIVYGHNLPHGFMWVSMG